MFGNKKEVKELRQDLKELQNQIVILSCVLQHSYIKNGGKEENFDRFVKEAIANHTESK